MELSDLQELHKNFSEGNPEQKINSLNFLLTLGATTFLSPPTHQTGHEKMIPLGTGLFIRAPKPFRDKFLKQCDPVLEKHLFDAMQLSPEELGLIYDPASDPKAMEILKKKDEETIDFYNEIRRRREYSEKKHQEWIEKKEADKAVSTQIEAYNRHEKLWDRELHQENHASQQHPLSLLIIDLVLHDKYSEAAKKFIGADLKAQKQILDEIKGKTYATHFIKALDQLIELNDKTNLPEPYHRAKVCLHYLQEC